jgi:hypothetical protein
MGSTRVFSPLVVLLFFTMLPLMSRKIQVNWPNAIAAAALGVSLVALVVSYQALRTGASEDRQKEEISTLVTAVTKLSDIYETQLRTNRSLQNSLDSQGRQIKELKKIDTTALSEYHLAKNSLDLVIADRKLTNEVDKTDLSNGIRTIKSAMDDLTSYRRSPKKDEDDIGAQFDYRISSIKNLVTALTTNRYVQSREYELQDLFLLIDHIQQTHLVFQNYDHKYREVDAKIVDDFFGIWPALGFMDKNDSSNNRLFKAELSEAGYLMNHDADSVFKAGKYQ